MTRLYIMLVLLVTAAAAANEQPLLLNQIQVIGTHNSYHLRPPDVMLEVAASVTNDAASMDYSHDPLDIQLDNGVRSFELDIQPFADGFHVHHVPIIDEESTCPIFRDCLATTWAWSQRHPDHVPISFLLEFKLLESLVAGKPLLNADAVMLEMLEGEILSIIPREKILAPDDVRGEYATLSEAVRTQGWPSLENTRGKMYFIIHDRDSLREAYTEGRPSLEGRIMFVNSSPDQPDCAFAVVDNPYSKKIPGYIAQGMIIRVRADAGLEQGRTGDTKGREAAFESGAHIISTDFPRGRASADTGYCVEFPGGAEARNNPVNSPSRLAGPLNGSFVSTGR
ncbi:MAG TPA: Ca2+-dependent phosphoinositide-specific phospholipase C [Candidatus Hydrogenedentes bacterium]|nr:Ca2+-dependent phosphoinositide-specific phospholipase C [Candidatus Hydrogenedentota bacterium]